MSSFHKTTDSTVSLNGIKYKNNLPYISTGIPSLDHLVGGGLPSGTIFLVEEDVLGNYSRVLTKYYLAEGVVCKHALLIASADDDASELVSELPVPCAAQPSEDVAKITEDADKMMIAWRYEGLGQVESSFGNAINFGHHFDLSKHVDYETIDNTDITYWKPSGVPSMKCSFTNQSFYSLLQTIKYIVAAEKYQSGTKSEDKNMLRICIQSLGSPVWMATEDGDDTACSQDLIQFFYCMRIILRDTNAVAYITMPTHLFEDASLLKRLLYSVDNAVKLESFAGSSRETNPVFKDYHGLFHITKISAINSLVQFVPPSLDLAFKLRRKKFIIEKLHLPPELQESSEREQDDITAMPMTCGGFKKKDIDF